MVVVLFSEMTIGFEFVCLVWSGLDLYDPGTGCSDDSIVVCSLQGV